MKAGRLIKKIYAPTMQSVVCSIALFFLFFIGIENSYSQGWERRYDKHPLAGNSDRSNALQQTFDGGYILAGNSYDFNGIDEDILIIKTNNFGDTIWTTRYLDLSINGSYKGVQSIHQAADSTYTISGTYYHTIGSTGFDYYLMKLDHNGDSLWTKTYGSTQTETLHSTQQTSDGGFILAGSVFYFTSSDNDIYLVKTDVNGDTLWTKTYGDISRQEQGYSIQQTSDGGFILAANTGLGTLGNNDSYLMKLDAVGDTIWTRTYDGGTKSIEQTTDGGYVLSGMKGNQMHVLKTDANGDSLWAQSYFSIAEKDVAFSIQQTTDGGYIVAGGGQLIHLGGSHAYLIKLDANGDSLWTQNYGIQDGGNSRADVVQQTADGGYIIGGSIQPFGETTAFLYLVKTDAQGNSVTNRIRGNVFQDDNSDCLFTTGESNLGGLPISATENGGLTYYTTTDNLGNYEISCGLGTYTVEVHPFTNYHVLSCIQTNTSTFTNFGEADTIDFPLSPLTSCPLMHVDVSVPLLRQTDSSIYTIQYCNLGTADAQNVSIDVIFDPLLNVGSFSTAPASQLGGIYTFNIGTVPFGQCGTITATAIVDTAAIVGQTHCVTAQIFPDSICNMANWGLARLSVEPFCQNDTAFFRVKNLAGAGSTPRPFYVFEDDIIMRIGNVTIPGGLDTLISVPAQLRKFYRFEVQQEPGYPAVLGDSIASGFLEGCNPDASGHFNLGFATQYPNGNSSPFLAMDCQANVGSFDPNNKIAQPFGYDNNHFINEHQYIDYQINFQNTGNDTAFTVYILDTISPYLDPTSIFVTSASHSYTWTLKGNGILEVRFDNIMLPDSFVNEPASHGFVKFRIYQNSNNPVGTIIENFADIYFDYNSKIKTNTTFHEIGLDYYTVSVINIENEPNIEVNVFPNPFSQQTTIEVKGQNYQELQLSIYDIMGREVERVSEFGNNKIILHRKQLLQGAYFYRLIADDRPISTGKIIVR